MNQGLTGNHEKKRSGSGFFTKRIKRIFAPLAAIAFAGLCLTIINCGGSGGGSSTSTSTSSTTPLQSTFTETAREITPNLTTSGDVAAWSAWDSTQQYSVFMKLFNEDSGWESVFGPLDQIDMALEMVEGFSDYWDTPGTYTATSNNMTITAVIETITEMAIPYLGGTDTTVTKKITLSDADGNYNYMVAFNITGTENAMVLHSKIISNEGTEYLVAYATHNETTGDTRIKIAGVADKTDNFKINVDWKGNESTEVFSITQYTNAAKPDSTTDGYWMVMGGGNAESTMSFRSKNRDSGEADPANADDYIVVATVAEMATNTAPAGFPLISSSIDSATNDIQKHVDTDHADCLGWLSGFPEVADLTWNY